MGVVENRDDPLMLGRCQCRVVGLHTEDKTLLPTEDLPWAYIMQPITSGAMSGIGSAPVGVLPGTWVIIMFLDPDRQNPIIMGTFAGIPQYPKEAGGSELNNQTQEQSFSVQPDGTVNKPWDQYTTFEQLKAMSFGSPGDMAVDDSIRTQIENSDFTV